MKKADVIIIGSGIAALQLARRLDKNLYVIIITKNKLYSSNSYMAQGGVAAAISFEDSLQKHYQDTMIAGHEHQNELAVQSLVSDGKNIIDRLIEEGMPFDRHPDGAVALGMEGAHSVKRILHAGGDQTGKHLIDYLLTTLSSNVEFIENEMAFELIKNKYGRCVGVRTKDENRATKVYITPSVVIATGGIGGLYSASSNHPSVMGDGMAMAYLSGAKLADMEFIQFHPTLLYLNGKTNGLISEAVRGEGATLIDDNGRRIMSGIHPLLELAPRHIVAQQIFLERQQGKEIFLDIRHVYNFKEKFPAISSKCVEHGVVLKQGRIPVSPGCHFMMGGILIDNVGQTSIAGLYAIGEASCSNVHGANRLASNSLLEGLVYGERLANHLNHQHQHSKNLDLAGVMDVDTDGNGTHSSIPFDVLEFKENMMKHVGIIRDIQKLEKQLEWLHSISINPSPTLSHLTIDEIQKYFMWVLGLVITNAALARTESRGGHIRSDFPENRNEWYKKVILHQRMKNPMGVDLNEQNETKIYA